MTLDIYPLDLEFQNIAQAIAAYLVVGPQAPVLVETGPGSTLKTLQARLAEHGYTPADIRHVLVTHIHLDHAGAAGWWARQGAQIYIHHVGAPHLVDPSRLLASARRIYGDSMDSLWGEMLPAPAKQVRALYDGDTIQAGGLTFTALDTPGHARHHLVYQVGQVAFSGDTAGVRTSGNDFISLPAPPPEFDLEAWQRSIERLINQNLTTLFLTHFGPTKNVREHLETLAELINQAADFIHVRMLAGVDYETLAQQYLIWTRERALLHNHSESDWRKYETVNPTLMSVSGLMRYWRKREEK